MKIIIVDTGCANLSSIKFAIEKIGYKVFVTNKKELILNADKIIIPGVGAAQSAMYYLKKYDLVEPIVNFKKPVLGICLGMQLLGQFSYENKKNKTLNIINESTKLLNNSLPLPHMGWNKVYLKKNTLFKNIQNTSYFYFTHSYIISVNKYTIATCQYSEKFSAVLQKDNFFGVQFHPELSGANGLQLLKNFLEI